MSSVFLDIAGVGIRLDGLTDTQDAAVRAHWENLLHPSIAGAVLPIEVRQATRASLPTAEETGSVDPRELELELVYGKGYTEIASTDLKGLLEWTGDSKLSGELWTWLEEREHFCGILENFLRVTVAHHLVMNGGFLAHGAVVFDNDEALLFIGPSGAGKSTVSKLAIASGRPVASDDLNPVAIDQRCERVVAGGSPFIGEVGSTTESPRPLRGIYRLQKDEKDAVRPIGAAESIASVFACAPFINRSPYLRERLLANIEGVVARTPSYALAFRREGSFWPLVEVVVA